MKYTLLFYVACTLATIPSTFASTDLVSIWKTPTGNLNQCLRNSIEDSLKLIAVDETSVHQPDLDFKIWNYNITGLDNFKILSLQAAEGFTFKVKVLFPYCQGIGSYKIKGNLFGTDFDSAGTITAYGLNYILNYVVKLKIYEADGVSYLQKDSYDMKITKPEGEFYMNLDNVHAGNLRKSTMKNKIINEHSNEMFDMLIPFVMKHLNMHIDDVLQQHGIVI